MKNISIKNLVLLLLTVILIITTVIFITKRSDETIENEVPVCDITPQPV